MGERTGAKEGAGEGTAKSKVIKGTAEGEGRGSQSWGGEGSWRGSYR